MTSYEESVSYEQKHFSEEDDMWTPTGEEVEDEESENEVMGDGVEPLPGFMVDVVQQIESKIDEELEKFFKYQLITGIELWNRGSEFEGINGTLTWSFVESAYVERKFIGSMCRKELLYKNPHGYRESWELEVDWYFDVEYDRIELEFRWINTTDWEEGIYNREIEVEYPGIGFETDGTDNIPALIRSTVRPILNWFMFEMIQRFPEPALRTFAARIEEYIADFTSINGKWTRTTSVVLPKYVITKVNGAHDLSVEIGFCVESNAIAVRLYLNDLFLFKFEYLIDYRCNYSGQLLKGNEIRDLELTLHKALVIIHRDRIDSMLYRETRFVGGEFIHQVAKIAMKFVTG
jgi:hypothetical protein